tara:strand:- start:14253 stop:14642 length:390 start_codon:yes stop_codon:yes gene_type:complete
MKTTKPSLLILIIAIVCFSCTEDKTINLTKMDGFPPDFMGCSCYYSENETDFKAQQFIYVDSYQSKPAYISVDNKVIELGDDTEGYEVKFEITDSVQLDTELWHKEGTVTITDSTGAIVTRSIYGECGC